MPARPPTSPPDPAPRRRSGGSGTATVAPATGTSAGTTQGTSRPTTGKQGTDQAATTRGRARVRARQGPRRDAQRTALRRHPLSGRSSTAPAAAQAAARAARATRGALGLSTARRAALLAVVVCALALTVAVPLRNYVSQRHELAAVAEQQRHLDTDAAALRGERAAMDDPAHVEALARARLGYARPGETPYRVELPGDAAVGDRAASGAALAPSEAELPWYTRVTRGTLGTAP